MTSRICFWNYDQLIRKEFARIIDGKFDLGSSIYVFQSYFKTAVPQEQRKFDKDLEKLIIINLWEFVVCVVPRFIDKNTDDEKLGLAVKEGLKYLDVILNTNAKEDKRVEATMIIDSLQKLMTEMVTVAVVKLFKNKSESRIVYNQYKERLPTFQREGLKFLHMDVRGFKKILKTNNEYLGFIQQTLKTILVNLKPAFITRISKACKSSGNGTNLLQLMDYVGSDAEIVDYDGQEVKDPRKNNKEPSDDSDSDVDVEGSTKSSSISVEEVEPVTQKSSLPKLPTVNSLPKNKQKSHSDLPSHSFFAFEKEKPPASKINMTSTSKLSWSTGNKKEKVIFKPPTRERVAKSYTGDFSFKKPLPPSDFFSTAHETSIAASSVSRQKRYFTPAQDGYIILGQQKFGAANQVWKKTLDNFPFPDYRTGVHLKDRWRNLLKSREVKVIQGEIVLSNKYKSIVDYLEKSRNREEKKHFKHKREKEIIHERESDNSLDVPDLEYLSPEDISDEEDARKPKLSGRKYENVMDWIKTAQNGPKREKKAKMPPLLTVVREKKRRPNLNKNKSIDNLSDKEGTSAGHKRVEDVPKSKKTSDENNDVRIIENQRDKYVFEKNYIGKYLRKPRNETTDHNSMSVPQNDKPDSNDERVVNVEDGLDQQGKQIESVAEKDPRCVDELPVPEKEGDNNSTSSKQPINQHTEADVHAHPKLDKGMKNPPEQDEILAPSSEKQTENSKSSDEDSQQNKVKSIQSTPDLLLNHENVDVLQKRRGVNNSESQSQNTDTLGLIEKLMNSQQSREETLQKDKSSSTNNPDPDKPDTLEVLHALEDSDPIPGPSLESSVEKLEESQGLKLTKYITDDPKYTSNAIEMANRPQSPDPVLIMGEESEGELVIVDDVSSDEREIPVVENQGDIDGTKPTDGTSAASGSEQQQSPVRTRSHENNDLDNRPTYLDAPIVSPCSTVSRRSYKSASPLTSEYYTADDAASEDSKDREDDNKTVVQCDENEKTLVEETTVTDANLPHNVEQWMDENMPDSTPTGSTGNTLDLIERLMNSQQQDMRASQPQSSENLSDNTESNVKETTSPDTTLVPPPSGEMIPIVRLDRVKIETRIHESNTIFPESVSATKTKEVISGDLVLKQPKHTEYDNFPKAVSEGYVSSSESDVNSVQSELKLVSVTSRAGSMEPAESDNNGMRTRQSTRNKTRGRKRRLGRPKRIKRKDKSPREDLRVLDTASASAREGVVVRDTMASGDVAPSDPSSSQFVEETDNSGGQEANDQVMRVAMPKPLNDPELWEDTAEEMISETVSSNTRAKHDLPSQSSGMTIHKGNATSEVLEYQPIAAATVETNNRKVIKITYRKRKIDLGGEGKPLKLSKSDSDFMNLAPHPSSGKLDIADAQKQKRKEWSKEEDNNLIDCVEWLGEGKWSQIMYSRSYLFRNRTAMNLKDRYRVLKQNGVV